MVKVLCKSGGGGYSLCSLAEVTELSHGEYPDVLKSRHAVRDFSDEPLDIEKVKAALKIAEMTPSACNRQSWRVHVYTDKEQRDKAFKLQGGCKGFYEDMQCAILVCGDLRLYDINELNLLYVDGGLYCMNLLNALSYEGLATIPLTMGMKMPNLKNYKQQLAIPSNEMPVLLIGVGTLKKEFKVACSDRYSYKEYTSFDQ